MERRASDIERLRKEIYEHLNDLYEKVEMLIKIRRVPLKKNERRSNP